MGISQGLGSSALLPAGLGFRNAIINGDFRINQRGFSSTTTSGTYGFDRWLMLGSGGTTTYSAQSFSLGNAIPGYEPKNFARIVTTGQTASNSLSILIQKIEDVRTFAGQQVAISFWARSGSGTPKVAVELYQDFGSGGSPSSGVATFAGASTLSTSWTLFTFNVTLPSISGKTLGSNSDSQVGVNLWVSAGSDFNSRTGSLGIQNGTFDFWGIQVEANQQATPFEQRPIGIELQLCQRYYEKSYDYTTAPGTNTASGVVYASSSTDAYNSFVLPSPLWFIPKRVSPTVTVYSQAGTVNKWNYSRSGVTDAEATVSLSGSYSSPRSQLLYIATGASFVSATGYGHFVASAEL